VTAARSPPASADRDHCPAHASHAIDLDVRELREERAAIGEYERGMPRQQAELDADALAMERRRVLRLRRGRR
jgi:hypothetical protein